MEPIDPADRCPIHHTLLDLDALRGPICLHCDQAAEARRPSPAWLWVVAELSLGIWILITIGQIATLWHLVADWLTS